MTRLVLTTGLCGLTVLVAIATAAIQSQNRERGLALDAIKEECDMLEAANGEGCELILAIDHGPLPVDPPPPPTPPTAAARAKKGTVAP